MAGQRTHAQRTVARPTAASVIAATMLALLPAGAGLAVLVPGGGNAASDCYGVLDVHVDGSRGVVARTGLTLVVYMGVASVGVVGDVVAGTRTIATRAA